MLLELQSPWKLFCEGSCCPAVSLYVSLLYSFSLQYVFLPCFCRFLSSLLLCFRPSLFSMFFSPLSFPYVFLPSPFYMFLSPLPLFSPLSFLYVFLFPRSYCFSPLSVLYVFSPLFSHVFLTLFSLCNISMQFYMERKKPK